MIKPSLDKIKRSQLLAHIIHEKIKESGSISFADYMQMSLFHQEFGFYNAEDYTQHFSTAPLLSVLFGQSIASYLQRIFPSLAQKNILELGAGNGKLALDILSALAAQGDLPHHYYIYEISPKLRGVQQALLREKMPTFFAHITWLDTLPQHCSGIILANEVLDALPVQRFSIAAEGAMEDRVVSIDNQFRWQASLPGKTLRDKISQLKNAYYLPLGYQSEINLQLDDFVRSLCQLLDQGLILFFDYGYGQKEYYHPERKCGTLTCFYQHTTLEDALLYPGLVDITSHVDFTVAAEAAQAGGCDVLGFTTQANFLLANNILAHAEKACENLTVAECFNVNKAIKYLTMPMEMGERIKVMALAKNCEFFWPCPDQRYEL